jgi:hypothetical protein
VPRILAVAHIDLRGVRARWVQELRCVDLNIWFPKDRQPRVEYFHTSLHEDFFRAHMETGTAFGPHRVVLVKEIVRVASEQIHLHLTYLPGLTDLIGRSRKYVQS